MNKTNYTWSYVYWFDSLCFCVRNWAADLASFPEELTLVLLLVVSCLASDLKCLLVQGFYSNHFKIAFYFVFWICFCFQVKDPFAICSGVCLLSFFFLAILLRIISLLFIASDLVIMWFRCHLCVLVVRCDCLRFVVKLKLKFWISV